MANPIYFKSVRYNNGTISGYRPSIICPGTADEIETAERVVLQAGLAMSPEELNLGVKSYLQLAPMFVAGDGMTRTVNGLIKWYASMSGNLEAESSSWDATTCKAQVKVSLLKDSKQLLAGPFKNEYQVDVPKINNISYQGATGVYNVIRNTMPIKVYGRYVQFNTTLGDWAKLIVGNTEHNLTCQVSGTSETTFLWPTGVTIPAGTTCEFVMSSCAEGLGRVTVNRKTVIAVAAPDVSPHLTKVCDNNQVDGVITVGEALRCYGTNIDDTTNLAIEYTPTGQSQTSLWTLSGSQKEYDASDHCLVGIPSFWESLDVDESKGAKVIVSNAYGSDNKVCTFDS